MAGLSELRARIVGHIASFRETWAFSASLAEWVHASQRTVFRALRQGKECGLIGSRPLKDGETPPGYDKPVTCGGSLRWTIGWGKAIGDAAAAVAGARVRWMLRTTGAAPHVTKPARKSGPDRKTEPHKSEAHGPRAERPEYRRRMTAEEIDAALAQERPPPGYEG